MSTTERVLLGLWYLMVGIAAVALGLLGPVYYPEIFFYG
jgi:hypothetical protein